MSKCPKCSRNVQAKKEWSYGPKSDTMAKTSHMKVKLYQCECGERFREYIANKTGKVTTVEVGKRKLKK